jgi:cytochrome c biogenesis protein CcmG/thiol:disulfide interchange protein DsbE
LRIIQSRTPQELQPTARSVPLWSLALPVLVVLIATATAVGIVALNSSPKNPSVGPGSARVGGKAPTFQSWDLNGNRVSLGDLKGRPVLLTFWATSCTACQDEFPVLQRIRDTYQSSGFTVLAVDYRETNTGQMRQFLARLHVNFQAVIDPQGTIAWAYGVDIGLPVNVWLDRSQIVSQIMIGEKPEAALAAAAAQVAGSGSAS